MKRLSEIYFKGKRWLWLLFKRVKEEKVLAVYDEDLEKLLNKLQLKSGVYSGKYKCDSCGNTISMANLGSIKNENGRYSFTCLAVQCSGKTENNV